MSSFYGEVLFYEEVLGTPEQLYSAYEHFHMLSCYFIILGEYDRWHRRKRWYYKVGVGDTYLKFYHNILQCYCDNDKTDNKND